MNENSRDDIGGKMANIISLLLISGVSVSAVMLTIGLVLLATTSTNGYQGLLSPGLITAPEGGVAFPRSISALVPGLFALKPFAVIETGLLILIATPVFRVAASVVLFLFERDYLYTAITLLVLGVLLISIFWVG